MTAGIFIVQPDGKLLALSQAPYDSEDVLQVLLECYPALRSPGAGEREMDLSTSSTTEVD